LLAWIGTARFGREKPERKRGIKCHPGAELSEGRKAILWSKEETRIYQIKQGIQVMGVPIDCLIFIEW